VSSNKFIVGQTVEFMPGRWDSNVPTGTYTVTRVMPSDHEGRTYRVRSTRDGQERVLPEQQLRDIGLRA